MLGFIIPMSILADQQTVKLRKYLLINFIIGAIEAFPQKDDPKRRVFPEAKLPTCVIIFQNSQNENKPFPVVIHPGKYLLEINGSYDCDVHLSEMLDKEFLPIPLLNSNLAARIIRKLYPHLKILFDGGSDSDISRRNKRNEFSLFLELRSVSWP